MKRVLLICCVSLLTGYCMAQEQTSDLPVQRVPELDSAIFISDLVPVIRENNKVVLNWRLNNISKADFVAVERGSNGHDFEVVAVLKQAPTDQWYEWVDDAPAKGRNLYRIRFAGRNGPEQYSKVVSTMIAGDISFRFYPNPVDNILIIRSETPAEIQIIDAGGKIRISQGRFVGLQTLNVSGLEKGIYLLRVNNRVTGTIFQERLLKN